MQVMESTMHKLLSAGFRDAVVVVVGGRGGIGSEVVKLCAEEGARIAIGSRSGDKPTDLPVELSLPLDIADNNSIRAFTEAVGDHFGRVDILVNTAGSSVQLPLKEIDRLSDDLIERLLKENAQAPLVMMREMAPWLREGNNPVIVNLSSIAAITGGGSNMVYAGAKAALDTMSRAMAKALGPYVRVVNVSPSALDTEFARGRADSFIEQTVEASALKRLASTREVAVAVLCAARLLTATTGVTLIADAGRHL